MNLLIDKECPRYLVLLATLNFVLGLYGYQLVATLGSPFMSVGNTQFITIPYRALCLGISLFLIFRCKVTAYHFRPIIICLVIYWSILILRLVYDFYIQSDFIISASGKSKVILFFLCINLPQSLSYAMSWKKVDYEKAFVLLMVMLILIAVFTMLFNHSLFLGSAEKGIADTVTTDGRITGGAALNTISFSHCGVALSLISLYLFYYRSYLNKYIVFALFCLGVFIMLRAGSRGPLVCFILMMLLYYSFKTKQILSAFFIALNFVLLLYVFKDFLLDQVKDISPVLYRRTMATFDKGDLSGRDTSFAEALHIWEENPILGKYFTFYLGSPAYPGYTHNIFLDSAIAGGMLGVGLMLYFYFTIFRALFNAISYNPVLLWIPLVIVHKYLACLSSGCFWIEPSLSMGLLAIALLELDKNYCINDYFIEENYNEEISG